MYYKAIYRGPVYVNGIFAEFEWVAETTGTSPGRCRANLMYRFKKSHGLPRNAYVDFPNQIRIYERGQ